MGRNHRVHPKATTQSTITGNPRRRQREGMPLLPPLLPMVIVALIMWLGMASKPTYAADGDLDPSFGGDGTVITEFGESNERAAAVIVQPDGKTIAAGKYGTSGTSSPQDFILARYNTDGSLDTSFDGDGKVITDIAAGSYDSLGGIALQSDGKIVVAGQSQINTGDHVFALARYNTDGSLDTSFDGDGKLTTDFDPLYIDGASDVAIQTDGKIVAVGAVGPSGGPFSFALARYNTDGSLDTSFSGDGRVTTAFGSSNAANAVKIQPDGKIVAGGYANVAGSSQFAVARYNTDGSLDTSFNGVGYVTTDVNTSSDYANDIQLQADGKIVAIGEGFSYVSGQDIDFALVRYNTDGSLDAGFDGDGKVLTSFDDDARVRGAALQSDGKIVAAGSIFVGPNGYDFALARYNTDGSLDTSFGGDGRVLTQFATIRYAEAYAVAIAPDTRIVAAGYAPNTSNTAFDLAVARYLSGGEPIPTPTPTPCTAGVFSDVPAGSTYHPYVTCLANQGVVGGYPDCTFRPGNPVTRGQLSKIVSLAANFTEPHSEQTFEDVAVGSTFHLFVERLASRSIVGGYACGGAGEPCVPPGNRPYFRTNANVTRGQTSKIVAIAKGLPVPPAGQQTFQDVPTTSTFWTWIEELSAAGAISGYACGGAGEPCVPPGNRPYFRPANNVTRGQSSKIVATTFFPGCAAAGSNR